MPIVFSLMVKGYISCYLLYLICMNYFQFIIFPKVLKWDTYLIFQSGECGLEPSNIGKTWENLNVPVLDTYPCPRLQSLSKIAYESFLVCANSQAKHLYKYHLEYSYMSFSATRSSTLSSPLWGINQLKILICYFVVLWGLIVIFCRFRVIFGILQLY